MKKGILYFFGIITLMVFGVFFYFFYAGEIKNTFQYDEGRFQSINRFIKQGKIESLSQAKIQISLIDEDFKPDSVFILVQQLNEKALVNAKVCLQKKWLGSCGKYLALIDEEYKPQEVAMLKEKLSIAVNQESVDKTKQYIKERNIKKAEVYYAKIDSNYNLRKKQALEKKIYTLDNELKIERVIELMNEKEFDEAREELATVHEDYDKKGVETLQDEIKLKEELEDLLDDEGAILVFVDYVKEGMNDPDSFEHVRTLIYEKGKYLQVTMKYREKNTYGAKVLNKIEAKLNRDGTVKKVINQSSDQTSDNGNNVERL